MRDYSLEQETGCIEFHRPLAPRSWVLVRDTEVAEKAIISGESAEGPVKCAGEKPILQKILLSLAAIDPKGRRFSVCRHLPTDRESSSRRSLRLRGECKQFAALFVHPLHLTELSNQDLSSINTLCRFDFPDTLHLFHGNVVNRILRRERLFPHELRNVEKLL